MDPAVDRAAAPGRATVPSGTMFARFASPRTCAQSGKRRVGLLKAYRGPWHFGQDAISPTHRRRARCKRRMCDQKMHVVLRFEFGLVFFNVLSIKKKRSKNETHSLIPF